MKLPTYTKVAKVEGDLKGADLTWEWEWSGTEHGIAGPNVFPLRDSVVVTNKAIAGMQEVPPNSGVLTLTPVITCDGGSEMRLDALVLTVGLSFVNPNAPCCVGVEGGGSGKDCNMYSPWKYLAVATEDDTKKVAIYNSSFELLEVVLDVQSSGSSAHDVEFSPDGRYLAVVGYRGFYFPGDSANITILRTSDWSVITNPLILGQNPMAAWSPDGKYLALAGRVFPSSQGLIILDAGTWEIAADDFPQGWQSGWGNLQSVAWSPDSKFISATNWNDYSPMYVYSAEDWSTVAVVPQVSSNIRCMAWSPDGKYLCTGGRYDSDWPQNWLDPEVYDTTTWERVSGIPRVQQPNNPAYSCAWSPDSKYLALSYHSDDIAISVIDMTTKSFVAIDSSPDSTGKTLSPVRALEFSPDGKYLVAGYAGGNALMAFSVPEFLQVEGVDPIPGIPMGGIQAYALSFAKANCCPQ